MVLVGSKIGVSVLGFLLVATAQAQDVPGTLDRMLSESHQMVAQAAGNGSPLGEALQVAQAPAAASTGLPNGASSITETFSDWTVNCAVQNERKVCATSQAQGNNQTGQQLFAIELYAARNGSTEGVLILPFGLDLQAPVTLAVGEEALGSGAEFSTCMPGGCIVPIAFSTAQLDALKRGTTLIATARPASSGAEPAQFTISLAGFTAATARVDQLAQ